MVSIDAGARQIVGSRFAGSNADLDVPFRKSDGLRAQNLNFELSHYHDWGRVLFAGERNDFRRSGVVYSKNAEADRAFFRDILGFKSVDAGHGWLIFALTADRSRIPPCGRRCPQIYVMCDDLKVEMAALAKKGVTCSKVEEARWGSITNGGQNRALSAKAPNRFGFFEMKHPLNEHTSELV